MDGTVNVWDFMYKQNDPTLAVKVGDSPIQCLSVQAEGSYVAVGARDGSLTVVELCESLSKAQPEEKKLVAEMLEREATRERVLDARIKEARIREKARQQSMDEGQVEGADSTEEINSRIADAEEEFYRLVGISRDEAAAKAADAQ